MEQLPRYHRLTPLSGHDPIAEVRAELARGGRVLWVCNLVDRAVHFANRCADLDPFVYHSRFRYIDRVQQHKAVIKAFDPAQTPGAALAICTQVAEMSLDLSATLLVSDLAPVPAMIQRLGRLNRRAVPVGVSAKPKTMPFTIVEPLGRDGNFSALPYDTSSEAFGDWPTASREWLERIGEADISQAKLATTWESASSEAKVKPGESKWLDGGPRTEVDALREASPGITVVMEQDLPALNSGKSRLVEVAIPMPMPRRRDWKSWQQFNHVPIAPADAIEYDPKRGAAWRN